MPSSSAVLTTSAGCALSIAGTRTCRELAGSVGRRSVAAKDDVPAKKLNCQFKLSGLPAAELEWLEAKAAKLGD